MNIPSLKMFTFFPNFRLLKSDWLIFFRAFGPSRMRDSTKSIILYMACGVMIFTKISIIIKNSIFFITFNLFHVITAL